MSKNRSVRITFLVSDEDAAAIRDAAEASRMATGTFIRVMLMEKIVDSRNNSWCDHTWVDASFGEGDNIHRRDYCVKCGKMVEE